MSSTPDRRELRSQANTATNGISLNEGQTNRAKLYAVVGLEIARALYDIADAVREVAQNLKIRA